MRQIERKEKKGKGGEKENRRIKRNGKGKCHR